ncbi:zinc finger protein rotund-like [Culicoides brevitarsis]|uniref:zinc finger protein rotund-like n=1 Tax=Culicoides brevitarsis TaxID=469753 RepID=UPI00307C2113
MAEIPAGEYTSHIHRSIDQLRQMNEKNAVYTLGALAGGTTDLRLHDYKAYTDLRANERMDYSTKDDRHNTAANNNNNNMPQNGDQVDQKPFIGSSPGTPPTPLSMTEQQINDSKIFASKGDLQMHSQLHMRESKPYKCSQCVKSFANSSYLSQHTRIHLGIKPYRCEICQRKFTQLSHLQQHIRTHTGDKPYKCRHAGCPKAFSQLSNLQSHSRCHQTDKPYKCNSCYKCFVDEAALLEHIPKHKESKHLKTHICQYCGKSYTQETYLAKHLQKHLEKEAKKSGISGIAGLNFNNKNSSSAGNNNGSSTINNEHPYWPKVSPDSAASLAEAMQQQQQSQYQDFALSQQNHNDHRAHENGEDLVVISRQQQQAQQQQQQQQQAQQQQNLGQTNPPSVTSSSANSYDTAASITKVTTQSAFTPIQTMVPHQLAQRPYFYDAINFGQKNGNQSVPNSIPNQFISLHQIRNFAHQPGLMSGEHLLAMGVGAGIKDKAQ